MWFQAEDGILDLVRSRGLGDVYKRQYADRFIPAMSMYDALAQATMNAITLIPFVAGYGPVSYTHLTLPTSDLV